MRDAVRNGRGDHFTKLLRRRIKMLTSEAKKADWNDKNVDGPTGCSDSYDESQRAWSRVREAECVLQLYIEWKGFKS